MGRHERGRTYYATISNNWAVRDWAEKLLPRLSVVRDALPAIGVSQNQAVISTVI